MVWGCRFFTCFSCNISIFQANVISTAKVIRTEAGQPQTPSKMALSRKFSPSADSSSSAAQSRSESPVSDSHTISAGSPLSFSHHTATAASTEATTSSSAATDSGIEALGGGGGGAAAASTSSCPPAPTTHHTSPKPERRMLSPEKEETRRASLIKYCPPQAYKFYMEQHVEKVIKDFELRRNRRRTLERELQLYSMNEGDEDKMRAILMKKETEYLRLRRAKLNRSHFKRIKKIGVGAFGEVRF